MNLLAGMQLGEAIYQSSQLREGNRLQEENNRLQEESNRLHAQAVEQSRIANRLMSQTNLRLDDLTRQASQTNRILAGIDQRQDETNRLLGTLVGQGEDQAARDYNMWIDTSSRGQEYAKWDVRARYTMNMIRTLTARMAQARAQDIANLTQTRYAQNVMGIQKWEEDQLRGWPLPDEPVSVEEPKPVRKTGIQSVLEFLAFIVGIGVFIGSLVYGWRYGAQLATDNGLTEGLFDGVMATFSKVWDMLLFGLIGAVVGVISLFVILLISGLFGDRKDAKRYRKEENEWKEYQQKKKNYENDTKIVKEQRDKIHKSVEDTSTKILTEAKQWALEQVDPETSWAVGDPITVYRTLQQVVEMAHRRQDTPIGYPDPSLPVIADPDALHPKAVCMRAELAAIRVEIGAVLIEPTPVHRAGQRTSPSV